MNNYIDIDKDKDFDKDIELGIKKYSEKYYNQLLYLNPNYNDGMNNDPKNKFILMFQTFVLYKINYIEPYHVNMSSDDGVYSFNCKTYYNILKYLFNMNDDQLYYFIEYYNYNSNLLINFINITQLYKYKIGKVGINIKLKFSDLKNSMKYNLNYDNIKYISDLYSLYLYSHIKHITIKYNLFSTNNEFTYYNHYCILYMKYIKINYDNFPQYEQINPTWKMILNLISNNRNPFHFDFEIDNDYNNFFDTKK
jgi:hypothetical protein